MTTCKHGIDLDEAYCMNCENGKTAFDDWWAGRSGKHSIEYEIAKSALNAAVNYTESEFGF